MHPRAEHGKGVLHAAVWDITAFPLTTEDGIDYALPEGVQAGSVDVITAIFVLSALHPKEWDQAIHNIYTVRPPSSGSHADLRQTILTYYRL